MNRDLICPITDICPVYKNWTEQTKDRRIDVIYLEDKYRCLAKVAIEDPATEGWILSNEELKKGSRILIVLLNVLW